MFKGDLSLSFLESFKAFDSYESSFIVLLMFFFFALAHFLFLIIIVISAKLNFNIHMAKMGT